MIQPQVDILWVLSYVHLAVVVLERGAQKLTGENLKVVWAEFSTLS
jgi:hypothetical protein